MLSTQEFYSGKPSDSQVYCSSQAVVHFSTPKTNVALWGFSVRVEPNYRKGYCTANISRRLLILGSGGGEWTSSMRCATLKDPSSNFTFVFDKPIILEKDATYGIVFRNEGTFLKPLNLKDLDTPTEVPSNVKCDDGVEFHFETTRGHRTDRRIIDKLLYARSCEKADLTITVEDSTKDKTSDEQALHQFKFSLKYTAESSECTLLCRPTTTSQGWEIGVSADVIAINLEVRSPRHKTKVLRHFDDTKSQQAVLKIERSTDLPLLIKFSIRFTHTAVCDSKCQLFQEPWKGSDVCFLIGGKKLHCHKQTLQVQSPVFERMFNGSFKEQKDVEVELPGKNYVEFEHFLELLYPAAPDMRLSLGFGLVGLFHEYQVSRLEKEAEKGLISKVSKFNAFQYLIQASMWNFFNLREKALWECAAMSQDDLEGNGEYVMMEESLKQLVLTARLQLHEDKIKADK